MVKQGENRCITQDFRQKEHFQKDFDPLPVHISGNLIEEGLKIEKCKKAFRAISSVMQPSQSIDPMINR
jgi:hypothetical protein